MNIIEFIFEVFGIPYTYIAVSIFIFCIAAIILGVFLTGLKPIKHKRKKKNKKNETIIK